MYFAQMRSSHLHFYSEFRKMTTAVQLPSTWSSGLSFLTLNALGKMPVVSILHATPIV